jgi:hypothetical protein
MAFRTKGTFKGPGTPKTMPAMGGTSSVGTSPPALKSPIRATPAIKPNTRDYGKVQAAPAPTPSPSPFGPAGVPPDVA